MTEPTAGDVFEAIVETPEESRAALAWPDESRIDVIGQNGNDGEHYSSRCDDSENVTQEN